MTGVGLGPEDLATLIKSQLDSDADAVTTASSSLVRPANAIKTAHDVVPSPEKIRWSAQAPVFVPKSASPPKFQANGIDNAALLTPPSFDDDKVDPIAIEQTDDEVADVWDEEEKPEFYYEDHQDRTIMIRGLSPFTTLSDLAKVIRGGIILNMYIRPRDRTAVVSFFDPLAAEKFVMHCRRNDIYLKCKRLDVTWADHQAGLPGHIQRQVHSQGATRNIVVRFAKKEMTAEAIKEDLDHIHRLEVVDIVTTDNHLFISLNGIQWAITARHCMQSRLKYEGTRIEFFQDECDQVLPPIERKNIKKRQENKRPATVSMANRFALLFNDEEVSTSEEEAVPPVTRSVSASEVKVPA